MNATTTSVSDAERLAVANSDSVTIDVEYTTAQATRATLLGLVRNAGYRWEGGQWRKEGFVAFPQIHDRHKYAYILVRKDSTPAHYAIGPDGYLPPADRPEI